MIVSEDVIHDESVIRDAASRALVAALGANRSYAEAILKQLLALYEEKLFVSDRCLYVSDRCLYVSDRCLAVM